MKENVDLTRNGDFLEQNIGMQRIADAFSNQIILRPQDFIPISSDIDLSPSQEAYYTGNAETRLMKKHYDEFSVEKQCERCGAPISSVPWKGFLCKVCEEEMHDDYDRKPYYWNKINQEEDSIPLDSRENIFLWD